MILFKLIIIVVISVAIIRPYIISVNSMIIIIAVSIMVISSS